MRYGRLPWLMPAELDEDQRVYYERLLAGPRDRSSLTDAEGRLYGAFNARLLDPPIGTAIQELGAALRFGGDLSARAREIVILEVAASERCEYEWAAHAKVAARVGMTDEEIEGLRRSAHVPSFSKQEQDVRRVARALIASRDLSDQEFAVAEERIGLVSLFDIISLVGHYQHTAMALRVWRTPLRDGTRPVFGPVGDAGRKYPADPVPPAGAVPLPAALVALLAGRPEPGATEQAIPFLTADPAGFPHVALLSRAEIEVSPSGDALFAVVAGERTRANLIRERRCTLIAIGGETAHYAKFRVCATIDQPPLLGCELHMTDYKADSLGIQLSPIRFVATGDLAQLEHWDLSAALLRELAGKTPGDTVPNAQK